MKYINLLFFSFLLLFSWVLPSCESGPQPLEKILKDEVFAKVNPSGIAPLAAQLRFSTEENCRVDVEVLGDIPVKKSFTASEKYHEVPVTGLYPGRENQILLTLTTSKGKVYQGIVTATTETLPDILPEIKISKIDRTRMEDGFHLVDMLIANNGKFLTYTLMFDDDGIIRWVMDMSFTGQITYSAYRLKNGNWLYLNWIDLYEIDDLGRVVSKEQMWGNAGNHDIMEMPDRTLLMGGSKKDAIVIHKGQPFVSRQDQVVQWDRRQNKTIKSWDLREVLDVDRTIYPPDYILDYQADWFHVNSIALSPKDNSVVVSGRTQGVVKVNDKNELQWIIAPHLAWGKAGFDGSGPATTPFLLTAVDAEGKPLPEAVQNGSRSHESFEWPMAQHSVNVLDNGNILLFDNGQFRNFNPKPSYSRAVEFKIDEENKTIQQVWSFGKEEGLEMFSGITSDVDILPQTGNRLITAGNVRSGTDKPHARILEISYPDNEILFEAKVYFKDAKGTKEQSWAQFDLAFRGERYDIVH